MSSTSRSLAGYTRERLKALWAIRVCDLNAEQIDDCLDGLPPASFNAHLRRIKSVLAYAVKNRWLRAESNPTSSIEAIQAKRKPVEVLSVQTAESLLRLTPPQLIPFATISLFAGVRVEEIGRLLWSDFNWEKKELTIRSEVSKIGRRRVIYLSDNLIEWLAPYPKRASRRVMDGLTAQTLRTARRRLWAKVREIDPALPINSPPNCLRHSYCSYHLTLHENLDLLLLQSGHSNPDTMWQHYHSGRSRSEGEAYFEIRPTG